MSNIITNFALGEDKEQRWGATPERNPRAYNTQKAITPRVIAFRVLSKTIK